MDWITAVAVYVIVWWLVIFTTLPFGVRREEEPQPGHDPGAPQKPMMWIKAGATTVIAALVTGAIWAAIEYRVIEISPAG